MKEFFFFYFLSPLLESRMLCLKNSRRFIDWSFDGFIDSLAANRTWFLFSSISQAKSLRKFVCSSLGTVCNELALGIQDLSIPNSAISASSFEADSPPSSARIYNPGGWRALSNDTSPYLEVSHHNIVSVKRNEFHFTHIYKKFGAYYSIRKSINYFWTIRNVCFESPLCF